MSIESAIEKRIKEAIARGEFDDLPGAGKPIDLSAYFNTPEDLRMAFSILKSNDFVPEEVEIFNEIADLTEQLKTAEEPKRAALTARINERKLALRLRLDSRRK